MPLPNNDMMSTLVGLANLARVRLNEGAGMKAARQTIAERIGNENVVLIPALELCDIKFKAEADDRPSVGDVNSHTDRWIGDDGAELGTVRGEGWKIASLGQDVISYYRETADTTLGRIETSGIWNSSAIWQSRWQSLFAAGVSAAVTGMFGVRQLYQEVPRVRYRSFVLLIPIEAADASLRDRILHGFSTD
ncbi:hypothetical protein WS62_23140 [Burkholderia sp. ABCPW 14]|nr:hypothetical protein WS62_23140 [Burkholderia sp. ABCPW 14]